MKIANISVELLGSFGDDLSVVNAARVSFHKEAKWENEDFTHPDFEKPNYLSERDVKLINYLAKHKHFSPFNHAFLSFRVKAPIFVARQLVKHKFLPWNEVSRRYVDYEPEFYIPEFRDKAENVKQGSGDVIENPYAQQDYQDSLAQANEHALSVYKVMLEEGICAEQARMVLPQNTMTEWVWSGTLGAFLDMLVLRLDPHTQKETREVAQHIAGFVVDKFPVSFNARINP